MTSDPDLIVIGGGLAGSEAAWQAAQRGLRVLLYEMRPNVPTGAHQTSDLAELVCSNSLGSSLSDRASGLLKLELQAMGSLLLECALQCALPAGSALAVDRTSFSNVVTQKITGHRNISLIRQEITEIPTGLVILATGPLTSPALARSIRSFTGEENQFFYDAIAPIVAADSINMNIAFRASRFGKGTQPDGDYINCPLTEVEYSLFVNALTSAERIPLRDFESEIDHGVIAGPEKFFEGCLPVEVIALRGERSLMFGPMRPIGLRDPRTGNRPHAILQLRQDNLSASMYNLVGFQTNLTYPEQKRVFRLIPGLENAEFLRFGQMHRNTYIFAPKILHSTLQARERLDLLFSGQLSGVEGYLGNIGTGLLAGWNAALISHGSPPLLLPEDTMLGALCHYITHAENKNFQPMKANFGILPPLNSSKKVGKLERARLYSDRAISSLNSFLLSTLPQ